MPYVLIPYDGALQADLTSALRLDRVDWSAEVSVPRTFRGAN
jgi:hypothetical protein